MPPPLPPPSPHPSPATGSRALTLSFVMLVLMLVLSALDQTVVSTALPSIVRELQGAAWLSWVFSAYLIAATVAVPLYGRLADLHGPKPVLLAAVALFLIGSALCGASRSMLELVVARGIQGAGGGGLLTLAMTSVVRLYPANQRASLQGLLGAAYGLSTMAGPLAGGFVVEHASWRWAFFINLPLALLAWVVLARQFPKSPAVQGGRMDYLGAGLLSAGLVALLLGTRADSGGGINGLLVVMAMALLTSFVWAQTRVAQPLLPLTLFANRGFSAVIALSAASGFALFAAVMFMPLYFQSARGLSPTESGWHTMPLMAGITLASIGSGRCLSRWGRVRVVALVACALCTVAFAVLAAVLRDSAVSVDIVSWSLLPLGMAIGALFPLLSVVAQSSAPLRLMGVATASPVMFRAVAGAVGVTLLGRLFHELMLNRALGSALSIVFFVTGATLLLALAAAMYMPVALARPAAPLPPGPMQTSANIPRVGDA
jgi:EmrB/QacA subfamily drug resistance transporter